MGIQTALQVLLYEGKVLQGSLWLKDYGVARHSTIILNQWLQGGATVFKNPNTISRNPNVPVLFKDIMKGKTVAPFQNEKGIESAEIIVSEQQKEESDIEKDKQVSLKAYDNQMAIVTVAPNQGVWQKGKAK